MKIAFRTLARITAVVALMLAAFIAPSSTLAAPPNNDNFADATVITALPFNGSANNAEATMESGEWSTCYRFARTTWWTFTPPITETVIIDTQGGSFDTVVNVYQATAPGLAGLRPLGLGMGGPTTCTQIGAPLIFRAEAGVAYYFQADNFFNNAGSGPSALNLKRVPAPANDDFDNATAISGLPVSATAVITGSTPAADDPKSCGNAAGDTNTVWYRFSSPAAASINITTSAAGTRPYLGVFTGARGTLTTVQSAVDLDTQFTAQPGVTYYIAVGIGGPGALPDVTVSLAQVPAPPNDEFAAAKPIQSLPYTDVVDLTWASSSVNDPQPSCVFGDSLSNVWYRFTTPATESVMVSVQGLSGLPVAVAAYTGTPGNLVEVNCGSQFGGGAPTFRANAGTTYYFQAGSNFFDHQGDLSFHLDVAPPPEAAIAFSPSDPSAFDDVQFLDVSQDPAAVGVSAWAWDFGDGTHETGFAARHRFARDGSYTVRLSITTSDGRTASTTQVVQVRTHDVAIGRFQVPNTGQTGKTRRITVGVGTRRYAENVQVQLLRSTPTGFEVVGTLNQAVPVGARNRTTEFAFTYTFTEEDARIGKVTFKTVATIQGARDALPADNELIAPSTRVTR